MNAGNDQSRPQVSVVVPMCNEVGNVEPLHDELVAALASMGRTAEVIFVDDGSTDGTFQRLSELYRRQRSGEAGDRAAPSLRVVRLRRNFGKAAALAAGFEEARGHVVITMDADLQDDPREIPRFLEALDQGYDLVSGWKRRRRDPITKVIASRLFNSVVSRATGIKIHDFNCGFKAYRGELARELKLYGGLHRYIPVLAHAKGFRCGEIEVEHRPRRHGRSKYGLGRLVTGFLDLLTVLLLTVYASRPLHFVGGTGLAAFLAGSLINAYLAVMWWAVPSGRPYGSRPLLTLGVLLMILGIQLISLGLVGEMIISRQGGPRETYSIAEKLEES